MMAGIKIRSTAFPVLLGGLIVLAGCVSRKQNPVQPISKYEQLRKMFADPPPEYRSAPLWDWNDKITREGIDFQMKKFKEGGLGGVFIHPRPGLITEYLSEDWHQLFDYTVKKGQELGLKVWIYDENSYPSGFAGGHVPAEMPDSYIHGTGMSCEVQYELNTDTGRYDIVLKQDGKIFRDITSELQSESGKRGIYYLFRKTYSQKSYWQGNFPYVDLLYPGVTEKFMDITMKGYEKYNRPDFGKTLVGIFTDEPNLEAAMGPNSSFRWTPDLFTEFKKRWGYDLETNLPSLVDEIGDWKKVRHNYYEVILDLFINRWAKPWNAYCSENDLAWTGHYWEHGWPAPTEGIDESAFYMHHQQPGIDMLGNEMIPGGDGGQFGNTRAVRELRSAANQGGRIRTLSETYGGAGWEISFANFKRLLDWEEVLGVNFVNQHLAYYTIKGVRKFDYPPSFSYHEPWWNSYKIMGDYIGRLSMATASGQQINKILVLQPNTSAWMYFSRKVANDMVDSIKNSFKRFVYRLERNHIEYDLGSEYVLRTMARAKYGKMVVGERAYSLVVIPASMTNMDKSTLVLLRNFLKQGGKILSFTREIPYLDGSNGAEIKKLIEESGDQWIYASGLGDKVVRDLCRSDDFAIDETDPSIGELYFQRRIMDDGQLILFVNSDTLHYSKVNVALKGKSLVRMDLITGNIFRVPVIPEKGMIRFETDVPPIGSMLYFVSETTISEPEEIIPGKSYESVEASGSMVVKPEAENVLVLNYLDVKSGKIDLREAYFMKAMHQLFDSSGFAMGNPWQHKIQYKQDYLALDTFNTSSAFEVTYHFRVSQNADLKKLGELSAVVERPELWEVFLNGIKLEISGQWWIDRDFHRFPLGTGLRKGMNALSLKAPRMSVHAELMPAYIIGNFVLNPLIKGFEISDGAPMKMGSWKSNGYPFYGQQVSYSRQFRIAETGGEFRVKLNQWNGTMSAVVVNGKEAGLILWPPYELNIGPFVKEGENEITVKVTGSLKNTFGYFYKHNRQWINGPGDWDDAPDDPPSLSRYFLMDYGLSEPFSLLRIN